MLALQMTRETQYEKDESVNPWVNEKGACKRDIVKRAGSVNIHLSCNFDKSFKDFLYLVICFDTKIITKVITRSEGKGK